MSTTPADRVREFLQAREAFRKEQALQRRANLSTTIDSEFSYITHKYVPLTEEDLASLLPPADPRSPALEVHDTWFSARTPDNQVWVEERDPEEFRYQCAKADEPLTLRKHTVYKYGTSQILKSLKEVQ